MHNFITMCYTNAASLTLCNLCCDGTYMLERVIDLDFQGQIWPWKSRSITPQSIRHFANVLCIAGPNMAILAWTSDELSRGKARDWYTHRRTRRRFNISDIRPILSNPCDCLTKQRPNNSTSSAVIFRFHARFYSNVAQITGFGVYTHQFIPHTGMLCINDFVSAEIWLMHVAYIGSNLAFDSLRRHSLIGK